MTGGITGPAEPEVTVADAPDRTRPWWRRRWHWQVTAPGRTWSGWRFTRGGAEAAAWVAFGEAIARRHSNRLEEP